MKQEIKITPETLVFYKKAYLAHSVVSLLFLAVAIMFGLQWKIGCGIVIGSTLMCWTQYFGWKRTFKWQSELEV